MHRTLAVLALALAAAATPAAAQFEIKTTVMSVANADSAARAADRALENDLGTLLRAQEDFFKAHGAYAASLAELPAFRQTGPLSLTLVAGKDWWVALGGSAASGVRQYVVSRTPVTERVSGTVSIPSAPTAPAKAPASTL
jgi:hypothetical protein